MVSLGINQSPYHLSDDIRTLADLLSVGAIKQRLWVWNGVFITQAALARYALQLAVGDCENAMRIIDQWVLCPAAYDDLVEQLREEQSSNAAG